VATVSNPAKLSSIKSVFGNVANNLKAYYRGGSYVLNVPGAYPNISTSATSLKISQFNGVISPTIQLQNLRSDDTAIAPSDSIAEIVMSSNGAFQQNPGTNGTWLLSGNAADFDVWVGAGTGTAPTGSAQNTWLNLATTRTWSLSYTSSATGGKSYSGAIYLRNTNAPQVNVFAYTFDLSVFVEASICPTCCFTPETMIQLSSGDWIQIVDVQKGDKVATRTGEKEVTEVITRTNRVMYQITFLDGRILNASEDHPLYVVDKGYAAINPGVGGEYKDLGIPDMLYVGDSVLDSDGKENPIVSIETLDYPHTVYTLAESEFYANGMLVY
jgi:hypothetical protein